MQIVLLNGRAKIDQMNVIEHLNDIWLKYCAKTVLYNKGDNAMTVARLFAEERLVYLYYSVSEHIAIK